MHTNIQIKKLKCEKQQQKSVPSEQEDSYETEKNILIYEKVHLNKGFTNINYFRKITEDNQESIIFPLSFMRLKI